MKHMPQSMSDFFRAFYYTKGGEFPGNQNLTPLWPMPTAREAARDAGFIGQPGDGNQAAGVSANSFRTAAGERKPSRSISHCWL